MAGHAVQSWLPQELLKVFAGQMVHVELESAMAPVYPSRHRQSFQPSLWIGLQECSGHATHAAVLSSLLKVPAAHLMHVPRGRMVPVCDITLLMVPSYPATHTQSSAASLCCGLTVFTGQLEQGSLPESPLKVLALQATHAPDDTAVVPTILPSKPGTQRQAPPMHAPRAEQPPVHAG